MSTTQAIPATGRYTGFAMLFHWAIALFIATNFLLVWTVDDMPKGWERPMIDLHKSVGLTVLVLAILRLIWRSTHTPPPMPAFYAPWERKLAHLVHWLLYGLIFLMPITGWIHDSAWKGAPTHPLNLFWIIPWFRIGAIQNADPATKEHIHALFSQIHGALGYALCAVVALHVAGALKHQFFDKQRELQRMWPGE